MEKFDGSDYTPELDDERLDKQIDRVKKACRSGVPMTLAAIAKETGDPEASISAQGGNQSQMNGIYFAR